jgi:drug/metabolite transporter (DMT)-like permease
MDVWFLRGLLIALGASVMLAGGLAMMKSRAEALPAAQGGALAHAIVRWLCDPVWTGGLMVETAGYVLYFFALAEAPVSLVAVMMQGGVAVFVIIAVVFLHERASPAETVGILGIIAAMALLGLSLQSAPPHGQLNSFALGMLSAVTAVATSILCSAGRLRRNGAAPAIASGVAFGLSSLYTKALADIFMAHSGYAIAVQTAASPWLYLMVGTNLGGLVLLQNSFHWARGIIAMPLSSGVSNLVPIVGGIIAFDETLPSSPTSAALRISAFALTIVASVLVARAEIASDNGQPFPAPNARRSVSDIQN